MHQKHFRGHQWPQVFTAEVIASSFFQVMIQSIWSGNHQAWIQFPDWYVPLAKGEDALVNRVTDREIDEFVSRMHDVPFQVGEKTSYHFRSEYVPVYNHRRWCICNTV